MKSIGFKINICLNKRQATVNNTFFFKFIIKKYLNNRILSLNDYTLLAYSSKIWENTEISENFYKGTNKVIF